MTNRKFARTIGSLLSPSGGRGRLAVFCYHQVLDAPDEVRVGEPTAVEFAKDVELIDSVFTTLTFGEAISSLKSNTLPSRAAVITFDDGYENNHSLAAPILESSGVPATFFVAGEAVDSGVMWNDLVIEAIVAADGAPGLGGEAAFLELPTAVASSSSAISAVISQLKYKPMAERWQAACRLYRDNVNGDLPRLMMNREMVADLAARGFEIGGHTINHPILKELPDADAQAEIDQCYEWVKVVTRVAPTTFAYPNGKTGIDFDARHPKMVANAGFAGAASTDWGLARQATSPYSVPRIGPWWRQGRGLESGLLRSYLRSYL